VFIGALVIDPRDERATELFGHLARFLSYWDDWLDLADDMLQGAPNEFLTVVAETAAQRRLRYAVRSLARIAGGRLFHRGITAHLIEPLESALRSAGEIGRITANKTLAMCRELVSPCPLV
jgi:hypothetical protein